MTQIITTAVKSLVTSPKQEHKAKTPLPNKFPANVSYQSRVASTLSSWPRYQVASPHFCDLHVSQLAAFFPDSRHRCCRVTVVDGDRDHDRDLEHYAVPTTTLRDHAALWQLMVTQILTKTDASCCCCCTVQTRQSLTTMVCEHTTLPMQAPQIKAMTY